MSIFIKGKYELSRHTELKIESYEDNGAAEWEDVLTVKTLCEDDDDDDITISLTRNHRAGKGAEVEMESVWEAEIDISKAQAILLARYILAHFDLKQ